MEIRVHGRGGQGGVTCAKILAAAYARRGLSVQTFGDYAGERSGAPVRAYTRVSEEPITNRNKVYDPDHLLVLDEHLMTQDTVAGLASGGTLIVNSDKSPESFDADLAPFRLATVDATGIARRHGIGTRTVVIVNTTIAGAFARVHEIPFEVLEETYRTLGFASNIPAAREAYEAVRVREAAAAGSAPTPRAVPSAPAEVQPIPAHTESPPTGLRTGSWSSQQPRYLEHLAPCNAWCPAGNDVVGFVQALARDGELAAAQLLGATTPLAGVCGRVCPAPCMEGCNRAEVDGAVNIRGLERRLADRAPVGAQRAAETANPRRVAIVGGGPAGLSAAHTLALAGHRPVVFDAGSTLGGVLATGIPSYRLPRTVLECEVADLLALGVEARCDEHVTGDRLRELAAEYDAVVLATGLQTVRALDVPGADLPGVEQGLDFLRRVNAGEDVRCAGHVVVLGGGNTAMDCARSALRAGADRVTVAYRRSYVEMPAIRDEIEEAEQEGIEVRLLRQPVGFHGDGRVAGVELAAVELGEPDETGRRRPVVTDSLARIACDHVLLALGQSADLGVLPPDWVLRDGRAWTQDAPTNVFAAGDLATGDGTVAHAIGSGRRAAGLALAALGETVTVFERPERAQAVPLTDIRVDHFQRAAPASDEREPAETRVTNFEEVALGLPDSMEAHRCFSCGHCTQCNTCLVYCPEGIVRREGQGYELDYTYCKGCGICVEECPRRAMEMMTP